jgi:hypothetical protein
MMVVADIQVTNLTRGHVAIPRTLLRARYRVFGIIPAQRTVDVLPDRPAWQRALVGLADVAKQLDLVRQVQHPSQPPP